MLRSERGTDYPYRLTTTTGTESTDIGVAPPYMQLPTLEYSFFVSDLTLLCPSHASVDAVPTFSTGESFLGGSYNIVVAGCSVYRCTGYLHGGVM